LIKTKSSHNNITLARTTSIPKRKGAFFLESPQHHVATFYFTQKKQKKTLGYMEVNFHQTPLIGVTWDPF
jgi:hypothetical protein